MRKLLLILIILLIAAYPFIVYFGLHYFCPRYLALIIVLIFLMRFTLSRYKTTSLSNFATIAITFAGIVLCVTAMISNNMLTIRLYPFFINLTFFAVFTYSLIHPPTIIEKLARLTDPHLTQSAIRYTKNVTVIWAAFFTINGAIALWTALFSPLKIWTFYNGFLSYILIGSLFSGEFIVRCIVKNKIKSKELIL
jgi:uncharacterized membrane protein